MALITNTQDDGKEKFSFNILLGKHLRDITVVIGIIELIFAVLAGFDRLNPTVPSYNQSIETLTDDHFWAGVYLIGSFMILVSLKKIQFRGIATAFASGTFHVWGFLCFFKSLTAISPVALSLSVSVFLLGAIAANVCSMWNIITFDPERL